MKHILTALFAVLTVGILSVFSAAYAGTSCGSANIDRRTLFAESDMKRWACPSNGKFTAGTVYECWGGRWDTTGDGKIDAYGYFSIEDPRKNGGRICGRYGWQVLKSRGGPRAIKLRITDGKSSDPLKVNFKIGFQSGELTLSSHNNKDIAFFTMSSLYNGFNVYRQRR